MKAKPFIKWVGGKGQLIEQLEALLPADFAEWENVTYIEPFVGGGAMLFYMLQTHSNITRAVINDINPDLVCCYRTVRNQPDELVESLRAIQAEFYALKSEEEQKEYFMQKRALYNTKPEDPVLNTTLFFFLNRTCFNGLYRVNRKGLYNVPFGRFSGLPTICDPQTIYADSKLLQKVDILCGDYQKTISEASGKTLIYLDPPYRPLNATSSFNDYTADAFGDPQQLRLRDFCREIDKQGYCFMQSNADCSAANPEDTFFEDAYAEFVLERVYASRSINSNASKRGKLTELLIHNYKNVKTNTLF